MSRSGSRHGPSGRDPWNRGDRGRNETGRDERRIAVGLLLPALGTVVLVAIFPLLHTAWQSLFRYDLRMPWIGRPFVGLDNYVELIADRRFLGALAQTALFTAGTVTLELLLGLALAVGLDRSLRARGLLRVAVLMPWAVPAVVAALLWRFLFESEVGIVNVLLGQPVPWFSHPVAAWVPLVLGDVWKTTPFVALLLLAGLQTIDRTLYEAARIDGAGAWGQFRDITLPLLRPALLVAALFRSLDAFRVFDLIFVLTGGGPGTATESVSIYAFDALLRNLRFGYGSALSVTVFLGSFLLALVFIRLLGVSLVTEERER